MVLGMNEFMKAVLVQFLAELGNDSAYPVGHMSLSVKMVTGVQCG